MPDMVLSLQSVTMSPSSDAFMMQAWNNGTFKMDASHAAVKPVGPARPAAPFKAMAVEQDSWAATAAAPNAKKGWEAFTGLMTCLQNDAQGSVKLEQDC